MIPYIVDLVVIIMIAALWRRYLGRSDASPLPTESATVKHADAGGLDGDERTGVIHVQRKLILGSESQSINCVLADAGASTPLVTYFRRDYQICSRLFKPASDNRDP